MSNIVEYSVFKGKYTQSWKYLERKKKINIKKSSNFQLASFIYYISNNIYSLILNWNHSIKELCDIEDRLIEDVKNQFIWKINSILTNLLDERAKIWLPEIDVKELWELISSNLIYLLNLFFWNNFHFTPPIKWEYYKKEFIIPWLWKIDFREEMNQNALKRKDWLPLDLKKAYFNSFLKEIFRGLLIPFWKSKDRIPPILEELKKIKNREITEKDIEKYKKITNYCIKKSRIEFRNYEREDYIQEWLLIISSALKKYEWKWFSTLENFLYTVVWNYFKDLRKYHFAKKRWWDEIDTFRMWESDNLFIDKYSFYVWQLLGEREAWDDLWHICPISVYPFLSRWSWNGKINKQEYDGFCNPIEKKYTEEYKIVDVPF